MNQVHRNSFDLFWERFCDETVSSWFVMKSAVQSPWDILETKTHTRTSLFTSHCVSFELSSWSKSCQIIWIESAFGLLQITLFWLRVGFVDKFWDKTANILEIPNLKLIKYLSQHHSARCYLALLRNNADSWCCSPYSSFWSLEWAMSWPWRQCYTASIYLKPTFSDCEETLKNWICQKKLHQMVSWTISLAAAFLLTHSQIVAQRGQTLKA